ncbi:regulator of chromosome condensation 1/beta-lactamase-inhibitor protein II [Pyronema domesticum]|uniref:Similar to Guanine nucleotide exchange factor SRM1 acc. no. P21827 n=1 Tax=Pyronema omphalodes (strain CBS 100304) TaxID=1076935 RepID=U4LB84_PYROM|nr:regulator of chromosome condensation 1/beta-lactamase-inhibitor protein II [Pyronema domesticum]CCX16457.1 Similar to Guanine nucleotide exchange factor SRM1; acc. no. P21827 [Pyronema omphalodes CBS 100304]
MFRPTSNAIRTFSRSFGCPQLANARRRLHAQAEKIPGSNDQKFAVAAAAGLAGLTAYQFVGRESDIHADAIPIAAETRKQRISAQNIQVQSSLENPGVYVWGDNSGKVIAPDSKEKVIKTPRRLAFFDGQLLRDLQVSKEAGVAVDENGDILQWGNGYSPGIKLPEKTLKGKNIATVRLTKDKVIALSKDGTLYSIAISKKHQEEGHKPTSSGWIPGTSSASDISFRILKPESLGYTEKISSIATGQDHLLVLTSAGRLFSSAASYSYPSRGQMGIQGLTYASRPVGKPIDHLQEITSLSPHKITSISAGDYHSVALTSTGEVFTFGDNVHGQLGFEYNPESNTVDVPTPLLFNHLYGKTEKATITAIAAGGMNSYFIADVVNSGGRETCDVLACGTGIHGNLGNGRWTHIQGSPTKIKALSGLVEYNETTNKLQPIKVRCMTVGTNHCAGVMANHSNITGTGSSISDVKYGNDVLWWGNNEFYQLGTGKRNNCNVPVYIQPLDGVPAELKGEGFTGSSSRGAVEARQSGIIGGHNREDSGRTMTDHDQVHRFQVAPEGKVKGGNKASQTVVCGRGNTAVYMKKC